MDALVAYLQVLGTLVDFAKFEPLTIKEFNELQQNIKNSQSSEQPIEPTNSNLNNENVK